MRALTSEVRQCLARMLAPGDVVMPTTSAATKSCPPGNRSVSAGTHLLFLLPYSPDLNPIDLRRENALPDRFLILII